MDRCYWNPVTGCTQYIDGCDNCYAKRTAKWLKRMNNPRYVNGFKPTLHWDKLDEPNHWKKPRKVFVNSMSDVFHKSVPDIFIEAMFKVIQDNPQHHFKILTKRSKRTARIAPKLHWPDSLWMGVSVENSAVKFRIDHLRQVPAEVRFLSLEPLLGPLPKLDLSGIDWVIVGGESSPDARPMDPIWVEDILNQCQAAGIPFFFKQWGKLGNNPDPKDQTAKENGSNHKGGFTLNGQTWLQYP